MRPLLTHRDELAGDWRTGASCQNVNPDLFFPPGTAGARWAALEEVRRICQSCPVQQECLHWALRAGVTDGVWGGLTPEERRGPARASRRR
ncbi:WhiB family transcriptional regulator, redox-sensing transcriptional regulator [Friedmanniella luteola]|uniref:Transcriptional regulator WhiB n=1 Tax=Friedmanniella luteola TaxID=546871 RepID=A0A1H1XM08_9ACTN|nr:WhiB family transcriptional regulator [Friedmanniella luteola]SDT10267.1 WhiB family transcriptional regulator, redox-sensing transcriptional regulator [Friedmanniella luteola]